MKTWFTSIAALMLLSCQSGNAPQTTFPDAMLAVVSDTHVLAPALMGDSMAVNAISDRKMLEKSVSIFNAFCQEMLLNPVDILIIPGDLTKDGERLSHEYVASELGRLTDAGIQVFVIPGNHDVDNPHARDYSGDSPAAADNVSPSEFESIYENFGYRQAVSRDSSSLSYWTEPIEGLCLLAIDACRYGDDFSVGGRIRSETLQWIETNAKQAEKDGKAVVAFMHHGLLEHFSGQSLYLSHYLVRNWRSKAAQLADLNIHLVFTGHFHAQDAVTSDFDGKMITDVETGSLVTWPCPFRRIHIQSGGICTVSSERINEIDADTQGMLFQDYARAHLTGAAEKLFMPVLLNDLNYSQEQANIMLPHLTDAIAAHFSGDEFMTTRAKSFVDSLSQQAGFYNAILALYISDLYQDRLPPDNILSIDLKDGETGVF